MPGSVTNTVPAGTGITVGTIASPSLPSTASLSSMTDVPDLVIPSTSLSPTSSAASAYGLALAGLLAGIAKDGRSMSAEITIPVSKTAFLNSIESSEPKVQQFFNDLGGTDASSNSCGSSGGGLLGGLVHLFGCALNKMSSLKTSVNIPDGTEPNFSDIEKDLGTLGSVSEEITKEEQDDSSSSAKTTQASSTGNSITSTSHSSSSSSSSTSQSSSSGTTSEILGVNTPIVGLPDSYSIPTSASAVVLDVVGSVLMTAIGTMDSSVSGFLTKTNGPTAPKPTSKPAIATSAPVPMCAIQ